MFSCGSSKATSRCYTSICDVIRGISKSILHFILHFILHSTILYSTLYSTQQFGQDVDVIDNFDINWSSKWLWPIIFSVRVIIQYMHVTCNIWHMTERLPSHNFDWFALLEIGFVSADIWISWFGPFAFVKPSLSHLRVLELECWISPETSFVFSMSNHPHFYLVQRHLNNKTNCTLHMFNFHLKKIFWDIFNYA